MAKSQPAAAPKKPTQEPAAAPAPAAEATPSAPPASEHEPAVDLAPPEPPPPTAADEPSAEPAAAPAPAAVESIPDLEDFIAGHERAAQALDLVVTAISHPTEKPRHYPGVYSGFPITTGAPQATYSDGSVH